MPSLSLVIPVYNEEKNLPLLMDSICVALQQLELEWEVVFVDDGSFDHSADVLKELSEKYQQYVRVVVLRRNFGQILASTSRSKEYCKGICKN